MAKKNSKQGLITIILLGVMVILYFIFGKGGSESKIDKRQKEFRYNEVRYTDHAKCRMECRSIDEKEIKNILEKGEINYKKSDLKDKPCPSYALEGLSDDNHHIRVVVGNCNKEAVIITVVDLDEEHECDCN